MAHPPVQGPEAVSTVLLCHRTDLATLVASWLLAEWPAWYGPDGPGDLRGDVASFAASPTVLPIGIVAFLGDRPVGFGALKAHSIPTHAHLSPWAAAGVVMAPLRGQGLGAALLRALVAHARALGHATVYCGTRTAHRLLERSGWVLLETVDHAGAPLGIYCSTAAPPAARE